MRSTVGISLLPAQAVAEGQGGGGCQTLYHAVALHTPGAMLVTADERYYKKPRLEGQISLLADFKFP